MKKKSECPCAMDLPAYVRGQLTPEDRARLEEHLKACPACATQAEEFRDILARLAPTGDLAPASRDLAPSILAQIPASAWKPARRPILFPMLLRVAALLALLLGVGVLMRDRPTPAAASSEEPFLREATAWLLKTQEPDGHWDAEKWGAQPAYTVGITALALTACLTANPGILEGPQAAAMEKGLRYLLSQQNAEGRLGALGSATPYNHGLGLIALLEAFDLQERPEWKEGLSRALAYVQKNQRESGAWGYPREAADKGNTSITAWQILALLRAEELGWQETRPHINRALAWLEGMADLDGRIGYSRPQDFPHGFETLTAAGALCLLSDGQGRTSDHLPRLLETLHQTARSRQKPDYYRDFFLARALSAEGSETARQLRAELSHALRAGQNRAGEQKGSCDPQDAWSKAGGRVYTTAMAVLAVR